MVRVKNFLILFIFLGGSGFSLFGNAVEIAIPSVSVNTGECFAINVNLYKIEDEDIRTAVIAFAFDPFKIQIGCNQKLNTGTFNEPAVYEPGPSMDEQPITLSNTLLDVGIKYRVAIYPQGVMVVVLWDGTGKISPGLLFTVPCKLTEYAIPGDKLIMPLISKEEPIYIRRTFPDNQVESQSFYCSLADINALPVNPVLTYGTVYVRSISEGEIIEGEGNSYEGAFEGIISEGIGEGNVEGTNEGNSPEGNVEGAHEEGITEGNSSEGIPEGNASEEVTTCGCQNKHGITKQENISLLQMLQMNNLNIGFMVALVVILRQL